MHIYSNKNSFSISSKRRGMSMKFAVNKLNTNRAVKVVGVDDRLFICKFLPELYALVMSKIRIKVSMTAIKPIPTSNMNEDLTSLSLGVILVLVR